MKRILKMVRWIGVVMAVALMGCLGLALLEGIYFAAVGCAAVVVCLGLLMANEVTVAASFQAAKGGASSSASASVTLSMTGNVCFNNVQSIGTSTEALDLGEAPPTLSYIYVKNLDATNYVELALATPATTQVFIKLLAGQVALFPPKTSTIYALANTAPVLLAVAGSEV